MSRLKPERNKFEMRQRQSTTTEKFFETLKSERTNAHAWLLIMQSFNFQKCDSAPLATRAHKKHTTNDTQDIREMNISFSFWRETHAHEEPAWGDKFCESRSVSYKRKLNYSDELNRLDIDLGVRRGPIHTSHIIRQQHPIPKSPT